MMSSIGTQKSKFPSRAEGSRERLGDGGGAGGGA